ncbi:MAG: DUF3160 domain-containing protein, partial [bacterium]
MNRKMILRFLALTLLLPLPSVQAQSGAAFDLQTYQNFLAEHRDLTAGQLLAMHPIAAFRDKIAVDVKTVAYLDSINRVYQLTTDELALLQEHGFVVSERLSRLSFGQAYLEIYQNDLPVFISTDALLHALHKSYDAILQDTE